jgi:hypothetical protein
VFAAPSVVAQDAPVLEPCDRMLDTRSASPMMLARVAMQRAKLVNESGALHGGSASQATDAVADCDRVTWRSQSGM